MDYSNIEEYMTRSCSKLFVHDKSKICLVNIPKNASSYLRVKFDLKHVRYEPNKHIEYTKIIVLRDPVDRLWSSYSEVLKLRKDGPYISTQKADFYKNRSNIKQSMLEFLSFIENNLYDVHVFPQSEFLKRKSLTLADMDFIYDFTDVDKLDKMLSVIIPHRNIGKINAKKFTPPFILDEEMVNAIYPEDMILYSQIRDNHTK